MPAPAQRPQQQVARVVFVHGYSCSSSHWEAAFVRLAGQGAVALLSLPGHDEAPLPVGRPLTIETCAKQVVAEVEVFHQPGVVFVGHSLGGMIGMVCVAERPELFRGLILVDAFPKLHPPAPFHQSYWYGTPPALKSCLVRQMMENRKRLPPTLWESVVAFDGVPFLARTRVPVRGIYGDRGHEGRHSNLSKALLDFGLGAAPDIELYIIPRAGHFVMLEQPAIFWSVLKRVLANLTEGTPPDDRYISYTFSRNS
ncbi:MAG: alpha/beta fold hydrolase [Candidatus Zipacnadales bacterium]